MSTISLVAQPGNLPPRVQITIATGTSATITALDLRRDGEAVRSLPSLGLSTLVVNDYEAAYGVPVTYVAVITTTAGSETLTASVTMSPTQMWLIHPRTPSLSVAFSDGSASQFILNVGDSTASSQASRHRVLGASRDVVMSFGVRSAPTYGNFAVATTTEAEGLALQALLKDETPILVRFPSSWDANFIEGFYAVQNWNSSPIVDRSGQWMTRWSLPLVPAVAPKVIVQPQNTYSAGLLLGTYGDSLAAQPTYYDRLVA